MKLQGLGVWTAQFDFHPAAQVIKAIRNLEHLGYGSVWVGENVGREPLTQAGLLLAATQHITIATGVANIWARDPLAMVAAQMTLAEAYPGRFILGLGVSHAHLVNGVRGHNYRQPLDAMRDYLDAMDNTRTRYRAIQPESAPRVLAALGPRMLRLAAERTDGAHTYLVPPEHTADARHVLGTGAMLAVEQAVVIETDAQRAREVGRQHVRRYLPLPNYTKNLRRYGFTDEDLARDGSDHLVDAIVAWGDAATIAERIQAHKDAGADHVCVQVLDRDPKALPAAHWRNLAEASSIATGSARS